MATAYCWVLLTVKCWRCAISSNASYGNDVRKLTPVLEYPLGEEPVVLDEDGSALQKLAFTVTDDAIGIAAVTEDNRLIYAKYTQQQSFLDDSITTELESSSVHQMKKSVQSLSLTPNMQYLYVVAGEDNLLQFDIATHGFDEAPVIRHFKTTISDMRLLLGGSSVLVGLDNGEIQQWMQVRGKDEQAMIPAP